MEPYLSVQLCLAGRPILQLRHFHIKPLGLGASPELTWGPSSPLGSSLVFWLTAPTPHRHAPALCTDTFSALQYLHSSLPSTLPCNDPPQHKIDWFPPAINPSQAPWCPWITFQTPWPCTRHAEAQVHTRQGPGPALSSAWMPFSSLLAWRALTHSSRPNPSTLFSVNLP